MKYNFISAIVEETFFQFHSTALKEKVEWPILFPKHSNYALIRKLRDEFVRDLYEKLESSVLLSMSIISGVCMTMKWNNGPKNIWSLCLGKTYWRVLMWTVPLFVWKIHTACPWFVIRKNIYSIPIFLLPATLLVCSHFMHETRVRKRENIF